MRTEPPRKTLALAVVALAAKALILALRAADGAVGGLHSPWAPLVLISQDLLLVLLFGGLELLLAAVAAKRGPATRSLCGGVGTVAYAIAATWMAINVPVARLFSTPATLSFLHATGGALGDSARVFVTPTNVGAPLLIAALAALLAAHPPPAPSRRAQTAALTAMLAAAIAGHAARASVATIGLHRNAVLTLLSGAASHAVAVVAGDRPSPPARCEAADGEAADLRDLRGAARGRNVVWVILESTAARFLTPYGARPDMGPLRGSPSPPATDSAGQSPAASTREVTPNLTALARQALLFSHAYAAYPESIKGLYSMLCARAPLPRHEASQLRAGAAPCDAIPHLLSAAGYRTALLHSGRFAYLGMDAIVRDRGFDRLEDGATIGGAFSSSFGVDDASTVRRFLQVVDGFGPDQRFFAVYMPIAGHHPYHAPGNGPRPFPERSPIDAYANDLFTGDAAFGLLRAGLQTRGLDDQTLYVVVGDHGEAFLEHEGNFAHSLFVYEENVRVPFLIAAPGLIRSARWAPQLASLTDVAPTVLDLLGLPSSPAHEGRSLLPPVPRLVTFFTDQGVPQAGLREGRWKLLDDRESGRARLFDLDADPGERTDLAAAHRARVARYRSCLTGF